MADIFYAADRERIKGRQMLPSDTFEYIKALEAVAEAAWELHQKIETLPYDTKVRPAANKVFDAMRKVNFLIEAEDE